MDPVKKIKDHIIALNVVSYDHDAQLELFLAQVNETLRHVFGNHSQYLTYLNSIHFRPISSLASAEESVRAWAQGKKKLRDLLLVVLNDSALKVYESWDERELEEDAAVEVAEAERIVAVHHGAGEGSSCEINSTLTEVVQAFRNKVRVDLSVAAAVNEKTFAVKPVIPFGPDLPVRPEGPQELSRIRIDLRDLNILDDGVERYLVHKSSFLPKDNTKRILFVPSADDRLNQQIYKFINASEALVVQVDEKASSGRSLHEQLADNPSIQTAVVVLSDDCWIRFKGDGQESATAGPAPAVCFQLGFLLSRLGRGKVLALYEESQRFRRPTGYFEVFYIPVNTSGIWRGELASRLKENKIAVKGASHPFFHRG